MSDSSTATLPDSKLRERTRSAARPLRILYIEQNVDGTTGGSYRSLLYLLKGLDKHTHTPLVAFYREHELLPEFESVAARTMLLFYPLPIDLVSRVRRLGPIGRALAPLAGVVQKLTNLVWVSSFLFLRGLFLLIRERIDILHLNNGVRVGNEMLVASKLLGIRCIIHQRGITPLTPWSSWLARRADHVICVSEAARQNLIAQGLRADRCTAIHNGINPEELRAKIRRSPEQVRASLGITPGTLVVGLAGMIRVWKGQMVLVKAMELLHKRHPDVRALIMGAIGDTNEQDRAYAQELRTYIAEHDLGGCITMLDYQPNAPEYLQIFDVMVHTAIDPEPFSRVVIEGMALGRPIVASDTGGTPEAIDDGVSGFLVPANDPAALADRVSRLVDDAALRDRIGKAAREKAEDRFHIHNHVSRTEQIYRRITSGD